MTMTNTMTAETMTDDRVQCLRRDVCSNKDCMHYDLHEPIQVQGSDNALGPCDKVIQYCILAEQDVRCKKEVSHD